MIIVAESYSREIFKSGMKLERESNEEADVRKGREGKEREGFVGGSSDLNFFIAPSRLRKLSIKLGKCLIRYSIS